MPVNGNIDGETGGFQEVGEEVPFDHPRLGDAHLFATYLGSLTFSPQAGTKKERRSRLSRSSTLPLGTQNLCWLVCPLFFTTLGWFSKTAQVEIVHLANLGVGMNMIPSSQHAATCSLCVMRN